MLQVRCQVRLFSKVYRVSEPATSATRGTGVGLDMGRRLVELHGGQVSVDGEHGSWLAFSLTVQCRPGLQGVANDHAEVSPDSKPSANSGVSPPESSKCSRMRSTSSCLVLGQAASTRPPSSNEAATVW